MVGLVPKLGICRASDGLGANEAVALKEAVGAAIVLMRSEIERHDVTLQAERAPDVPPARGDRLQSQPSANPADRPGAGSRFTLPIHGGVAS
jgi:hypothetical protein